jgi:hypothetical protein
MADYGIGMSEALSRLIPAFSGPEPATQESFGKPRTASVESQRFDGCRMRRGPVKDEPKHSAFIKELRRRQNRVRPSAAHKKFGYPLCRIHCLTLLR